MAKGSPGLDGSLTPCSAAGSQELPRETSATTPLQRRLYGYMDIGGALCFSTPSLVSLGCQVQLLIGV